MSVIALAFSAVVLSADGAPASAKLPSSAAAVSSAATPIETAPAPVQDRAAVVVQRAIAAAGGADALAGIRTLRYVGIEHQPDAAGAAAQIDYKREITYKKPARLKQVLDWTGNRYGPMIYTWNDHDGWAINMGVLSNDSRYKSYYTSWRLTFIGAMAEDLLAGTTKFRYLREDKLDGRAVDVLEGRSTMAPTEYWFDRATGHLAMHSLVTNPSPSLGTERQEQYFEDYRKLDGGLVLPARFRLRRVNKFVSQWLAVDEFPTLEVNLPIDDAVFAVPKEIPKVPEGRIIPKPSFEVNAPGVAKPGNPKAPETPVSAARP